MVLHVYHILLIQKSLKGWIERDRAFQLTPPSDARNMDIESKGSSKKIWKRTDKAEIGEHESDSIIRNDAMVFTNYQINVR